MAGQAIDPCTRRPSITLPNFALAVPGYAGQARPCRTDTSGFFQASWAFAACLLCSALLCRRRLPCALLAAVLALRCWRFALFAAVLALPSRLLRLFALRCLCCPALLAAVLARLCLAPAPLDAALQAAFALLALPRCLRPAAFFPAFPLLAAFRRAFAGVAWHCLCPANCCFALLAAVAVPTLLAWLCRLACSAACGAFSAGPSSSTSRTFPSCSRTGKHRTRQPPNPYLHVTAAISLAVPGYVGTKTLFEHKQRYFGQHDVQRERDSGLVPQADARERDTRLFPQAPSRRRAAQTAAYAVERAVLLCRAAPRAFPASPLRGNSSATVRITSIVPWSFFSSLVCACAWVSVFACFSVLLFSFVCVLVVCLLFRPVFCVRLFGLRLFLFLCLLVWPCPL